MGGGSTYSFVVGAIPQPGGGSPYSFTRGLVIEPGGGSAYSFIRGVVLGPGGGSTYSFFRGGAVDINVFGLPTGGVVDPSAAPQTFSGTTEGLVSPSVQQTYSGPTSGTAAIPPSQTYSGPTSGIAAIPPSQIYSGPTAGSVAGLAPPRWFGAVTGGTFIGLAPPLNLTATVIDAGCIRLDWIDSGPNETGYRIERSLENADDWEVIGTVDQDIVTFMDRFAVPLTVYDYRVFSFDDLDREAVSNIATAVTGLPPDLSTPPPPVAPVDPPRNRIDPENVEFLSPGIYGLEKDEDGNITGFKF